MLKKIDKILSKQAPIRLAVLSFLLVAIIGAIDYLTGSDLAFSIFYLIPVVIGTWYLRGNFGIVVCIVSAATWMGIDYNFDHQYSHWAIPFWNTSVRLGFFIIVSKLLERLHFALDFQLSLAELDGLTGLLNSRTFKQRCSVIIALASRNKFPMVLSYIDLDDFKGINDRFGHIVGDQVLRAVAATLTKQLRASDIVARLGGDEFSVLLPETNLSGARKLFARLHESLLKLTILNQWPIGFSIGVAVFNSPVASTDEAIQYADVLMYKVKSSGKNKILYEEYGEASHSA